MFTPSVFGFWIAQKWQLWVSSAMDILRTLPPTGEQSSKMELLQTAHFAMTPQERANCQSGGTAGLA